MQGLEKNQDNKAVSLKQFILATFLMNLTAKFVIAPVVMLKTGGRSALPTLLIEQGLEMLEIAMIIIAGLIVKGFGFQELLENAFGKWIARFVCGFVLVYSIFKVLLLMSFLNNFLSKGFFDSVIWALYCVPLVFLLVEFGKRSLRSIGRTSEIFAVFILISLILIVVLVLKNAEFYRLLPLEGNADGGISRTMRAYPMWFGDYMPILIFLGRVKSGKHYKKILLISGFLTFLMVIFSFCVIFASYVDLAHYMDFSKKVSSVTQISVSRFNSGRIDIILYAVQMIAVIILACQYFFLAARSLEFSLGFKEPVNFISWVLGGIVYASTAFLLSHEGKAFWFFTEFIVDFAWIVQILVPIFVLVGAIIITLRQRSVQKIEAKGRQTLL